MCSSDLDGGKVADTRFAVHLDGREQSGLRRRQRHLDALRSQSVQPGYHSEQVGTESLLKRDVCGVDDVVHMSMLA